MSREKEFDRDKALHQAMLVFWSKGYKATNIPDLLQSMKLSRSSLYNTFGDKHMLYISTLELYKKNRSYKLDILSNASSVKEGLRLYFEQHISSMYDTNCPDGCFITNTAVNMVASDGKLKELIKDSFIDLEDSFYKLLERGQRAGQIKNTVDIKDMACLLLNLNHSINIMSKINIDKKKMQKMINVVICNL